MKKTPTIVLLLLLSFSISVLGQKKEQGYIQEQIDVIDPVVCPLSTENIRYYNPPPEEYFLQKNGKTTAGATINVTYIGFSGEPQAQAAFQKAVDIWASVLKSSVIINIEANWKALEANVLGSASPTTFFRNFNGAPKVNTWYPIALAEKLARQNLNGTNPDIRANFNSTNASWYFGTDGVTPTGKYDLVSVVLHEIGHGLGFYSGRSIEGTLGSMRLSGFPIIYDQFVQNEASQSLLDLTVFEDPSTTIRNALLNPLFFSSPILLDKEGQRATLYSPTTFAAGSSTSHLNQSTYQATANGLMTPQLAAGLSNQNPGPIMTYMFEDMGWKNTFIVPDTLLSTESVPANFTVKAKITSDATPDFTTLKLYYSADSFLTSNNITMTATGQPDEYTATFPSAGSGKTMRYYVTVKDDTKRFYFSPGEASAKSNYFSFYVGPDNIAPVVGHTPVPFIFLPTDTASLSATATDVFGIQEVKVEYLINGVAKTPFNLTKAGSSNNFNGKFSFPGGIVKGGDVVTYRLVVKDKSVAQNIALSPATGYYSFNIEAAKPAQAAYKNDFNTATTDFLGNSFSITTPGGFSNPAIHSDHPYKNGSGPNNESNYIYQLKIPITVRATNALIRFDEIVLVEPGETGSVFGTSEFYDYVVVEGSKDGGITWTPLEDGYDSRANSTWLSVYNTVLPNGALNVGTPNLFKTRYLDFKKKFATNDNVLIRFRLFADPGANGWGWAIDNLEIQGDLLLVTGVDDLKIEESFSIFPNPTDRIFTVEGNFEQPVQKLNITVHNAFGELVFTGDSAPNTTKISEKIDLNNAANGLYVVHVKINDKTFSKKVLVVK